MSDGGRGRPRICDAPGHCFLAGWRAKAKLHHLLALARTNPARSQIAHRLHATVCSAGLAQVTDRLPPAIFANGLDTVICRFDPGTQERLSSRAADGLDLDGLLFLPPEARPPRRAGRTTGSRSAG